MVWLNQKLGQAVRDTIAQYRAKLGPALCSEVDDRPKDRVIADVVELVGSWQRKVVFIITPHGSEWRVRIVEMEQLASILTEAVETEEVVSLVDPVGIGGCSVTFSPCDADSVEVLLIAWGDREPMASELDVRLDGGGTFRGN